MQCQLDQQRIWTRSTAGCGADEFVSVIDALGDNVTLAKPECKGRDQVYASVRCCAGMVVLSLLNPAMGICSPTWVSLDDVVLQADLTCEQIRNEYFHLSQIDRGTLANGWSNATALNLPICASSFTAFNATGDLIVSDDPNARCQSGTPVQAEQVCAMTGARLCTANEIVAFTYGTGNWIYLDIA